MKKILIVAPHPDDETLGVGGTLLRHKHEGDQLFWLIMSNAMENPEYTSQFKEVRKDEIERVKDFYGFEKVFEMPYQVTKLDKYPVGELVGSASRVIDEVRADTLYCPFKGDVHSDHRVVFDAVVSAAKTFRNPSIKRLLMYETVSETDFAPPLEDSAFIPNVYIDITQFMEDKLKVAEIYASELGKHPFPRSIESLRALATLRGSQAGVSCAEAFMLFKELI